MLTEMSMCVFKPQSIVHHTQVSTVFVNNYLPAGQMEVTSYTEVISEVVECTIPAAVCAFRFSSVADCYGSGCIGLLTLLRLTERNALLKVDLVFVI